MWIVKTIEESDASMRPRDFKWIKQKAFQNFFFFGVKESRLCHVKSKRKLKRETIQMTPHPPLHYFWKGARNPEARNDENSKPFSAFVEA